MLNAEKLEELKKRLTDGKAQVVSDTFNDNTHSVYAPKPIAELKFKPRISEKLIFPLLMAFPFDPLLGKETEEYGPTRKYSVLEAPDDMMQLIKKECNENEDLKNFYKRMAGFKGEWDTADFNDVYTPEDKQILWIYRRRITYVFPALKVNSKNINGDKFPTIYLLDSSQDPVTGEFTGELSFMHTAGSMLGSLCRREIESFNTGIEKKNPDTISRKMARSFALADDYLDEINSTDDQTAKDRRQDIKKYYPLSAPYPLLTTIGLMFSLTPVTGTPVQQVDKGKYELYDHFTSEIMYKKHLFFTANFASRELIDQVIGNYFPKDPRNFCERQSDVDVYANFCALDFITESNKAEMTPDEKRAAALATKFSTEKKPLYMIEKDEWSYKGLDLFSKRITEFFPYMVENNLVDNVRGLLLKSYKSTTSAMERSTARELATKFNPSSPLYSSEIKTQFAQFLNEIFPDQMAEFAIEAGGNFEKEMEELQAKLIAEESAKTEGYINPDLVDDEDDDVGDPNSVISYNEIEAETI